MNTHGSSLLVESKRGDVHRVAVAYAVVSWLLVQAASILLPTLKHRLGS
jgi:hypothetical protein